MKANTADLPPPAQISAPAEAVTALYRAHALGLIRLAVVMLGDRPAGEDVVQEAFCGLYRRWHHLSDTGKALSYVRSSVINGCRSVLRRRARQAGLAGDPPGGGLLAHSRPAMTLSNSAGTGETLYVCPGNSIITPNGSAVVCPATQITYLSPNGLRYSTGFAEFSTATGRVARILGHWATGQSTGPRGMDVLWSDASGRVLIGVIRVADRNWVGVISGNEFTPLNVRWNPAAPDFGTW